MTTAVRPQVHAAATDRHGRRPGGVSNIARQMVRDLLAAPVVVRRAGLAALTEKDWPVLLREAQRETGSLYGLWHDTPSGFIEDVVGETVWGRQRAFLDAIVTHKRVVVPAGFGVGKTWGAGRLVAWAGAVNPPGTIVIPTTATRERQVKRQLWPHIRAAIAKGKLPGRTDIMQWVMPTQDGLDVVASYGFSAAPTDEAAMQGIHGTPRLLLVVDEAGGISRLIGRGTNNLLTGDARMIAIGNPAMDDPGSWFEDISAEGEDPDEQGTLTIRVSALDSPALTGEPTPICRACVPNLDGHTIAGGSPSHLPDADWLKRTLREYGAEVASDQELERVVKYRVDPQVHPYVTSKVFALFPKDAGAKAMPSSWVEAGTLIDDPVGPEYARLCDLGLPDERDEFTVAKGSWIRLGVDVASDGGDEFAIYRSIGDVVHPVHFSSGSQNADAVKVSEVVLEQIDRAQRLAHAIGSEAIIRVKVDANGLGWGVVGNLERWFQTGRHKAHIVAVMVSETPERRDPAALMPPDRKRDEMWLAGRFLLQPDPSTGFGRWRLRVDHKCKVQLSLPNLSSNRAGFQTIERKSQMKARGVSSPDRAEAALLAVYEPFPLGQKRRRGLIQ